MTALRVSQGRRPGVRRLPVRPIRVRTPLLARAFRNGGPDHRRLMRIDVAPLSPGLHAMLNKLRREDRL